MYCPLSPLIPSFVQSAGDFWLYHFLSFVLVLYILKAFLQLNRSLKERGYTQSYIRLLVRKPTLFLNVVVLYWLCGILAACSNLSNPQSETLWDAVFAFVSMTLCFWIDVVDSLPMHVHSSSLQQPLLEQSASILHVTRRSELAVNPCESKDLSVFVESFNCGEKWITDVDLRNYVPKDKDIYVFSLQECMKPESSISAIRKLLDAFDDSYLLKHQSIGGKAKLLGYHGTITVIVAVRKSVIHNFIPSTPSQVYEGFGFSTFRCGNKGSVAVRLRLANQTLLVIASHFSSDLKVCQMHCSQR